MTPHDFYWAVEGRTPCSGSVRIQTGDIICIYQLSALKKDWFSRAIVWMDNKRFEVRYDTKDPDELYWWYNRQPTDIELMKLRLVL